MRGIEYAEIQEYVEHFDLVPWLESHGFRARGSEGEWVGTCPQCGKAKLTVNVTRRGWHCFPCQRYEIGPDGRRRAVAGAGGVLRLIRWMTGSSYREALSTVLSGVLYTTRPIDVLPESELVLDMLEVGLDVAPMPPPDGWRPFLDLHPYLARRGFSIEDVRRYGLFTAAFGAYANRVFFPVWARNELIYWQARTLYDAHEAPPGTSFLKVRNPSRELGRAVSSEVLFNLEQAAQYPRVALCEGPMSAMTVGPDAVATFGKQLSPHQIMRLVRAGVRAVDLFWDGPSEGEPRGARDEMLAAAPLLRTFFADVRLVWLEAGDPNDVGREGCAWARSRAVDADRLAKVHWLP